MITTLFHEPHADAQYPRPAQNKKLKSGTFFGIEPVDSVTRLCAMNLLPDDIGETESGSGVPLLNQEEKQSRDGSATLSPALDRPVVLSS